MPRSSATGRTPTSLTWDYRATGPGSTGGSWPAGCWRKATCSASAHARCRVGGIPREDISAEVELRRSASPELTRRELDVLTSLCRPALSDEAFVAPATAREIAADLVVTEAAVKQHLLRLYQKFRIPEGTEPAGPAGQRGDRPRPGPAAAAGRAREAPAPQPQPSRSAPDRPARALRLPRGQGASRRGAAFRTARQLAGPRALPTPMGDAAGARASRAPGTGRVRHRRPTGDVTGAGRAAQD